MLELNGAANTGRNAPKTPTGGAEPLQVILEIQESQSERLLNFSYSPVRTLIRIPRLLMDKFTAERRSFKTTEPFGGGISNL